MDVQQQDCLAGACAPCFEVLNLSGVPIADMFPTVQVLYEVRSMDTSPPTGELKK